MELQVGVKALLQNKDGKYLLVRRSPVKYPNAKGTWDIVGGRINPGTPLLDNLRREIKEEIGCELAGVPRLIAAQDILRSPERHVVRLTYIGDIYDEPKLDMSENVEYRWLTLRELEKVEDLDIYFKALLDEGVA